MKDIISVCGLKCNECGCFQATLHDDDRLREQIAEEWSKAYGADVEPEDINCDGCNTDSERVYEHCHECEMRNCAFQNEFDTCAECPDYPCAKLEDLHRLVPSARANLNALRDIILK
jgi:hypothetical protein